MNASNPSTATADVIRYIIVVHGIGEQRKGETAIEVACRFAEARRGMITGFADGNILTLGKALSQMGKTERQQLEHPWTEFKGIPQDPNAQNPGPFYGEFYPDDKDHKNLCFVDMHWADIMQKDANDVLQPAQKWATGLLGRLKEKKAPKWVIKFLDTLCTTLVVLDKVLSFKYKGIDTLVFTKYLGDVQQYGEYAHCRGQAVRRFHDWMAKLETQHNGRNTNTEARYTIIAHSLGTVMSMDALLYAHLNPDRRDELQTDIPNIPFPGYRKKMAGNGDMVVVAPPSVGWVDKVDSFVTLGSPINKFLILYWLNYKYLLESEKFTSKIKTENEKTIDNRIKLFNYCDEQDPVGHYLDIAKSTPVFNNIFAVQEDIVFTRYPVPGAAHNEYWNDRGLFNWILKKAVDQLTDDNDKPAWFDLVAYKKVLRINYKVIPYTVIGLDYIFFTWAFYAEGWHASGLAALLFFAVCWLGRKMLDLLIWWRQVLRKKAELTSATANEIAQKKIEEQEKASKRFERYLRAVIYPSIGFSVLAVFMIQWNNKIIEKLCFVFFISIAAQILLWRVGLNSKNDRDNEVDFTKGIWIVIKDWIATRTGVWLTVRVPIGGLLWYVLGKYSDKEQLYIKGLEYTTFYNDILINMASFSLITAVVFSYIKDQLDSVARELDKDTSAEIDFNGYAKD